MADSTNIPRDSRRVPLETRVQFKFDRFSGFISEYSSNISPGGMFIKTRSPLQPGQTLDFAFRLGDGFELIKGRGEVVWTRAQDEGPTRPAGMGLRFLELGEGSRELIYRIVDQHIQEGGTPFDVSLVPPDPIPLPPPPASLLETPLQEPFAPIPPRPEQPDSTPVASDWLPSFESAAGPPSLAGIPGLAEPTPGPAPEPQPIFGSASTGQPRRILPLALGAAVLLLVVVGAFVFGGRLADLAGRGDGGEKVAQAPARTVRPAPEPAPPAGEPAVQEPAVASVLDTAAAAPAHSEPPKPTGQPLTAVKDITWEEAFGGTDVILWSDGAVRSEVYERTRIDGNPPRELIRLKGIERPFPKARVVVGTTEVLQVRVGYHPRPGGNELHIVLDLAHPDVAVTRVEEGEERLRIHLQRRGEMRRSE
ncbi:MAG TPA: TIGR02266 family protein [Thermoanaerobaculia bacterium]|nr:TIGR02266 family protein [Thermoanaerobaculia bacterium]